jgi:hypothetical protein
MVYIENVFIRGKYLGSVFEYSSTIKPTGVKSERVFFGGWIIYFSFVNGLMSNSQFYSDICT